MCNDYGTVLDVFIPNKKTKAGKRFAFVRFIKVINLDRLIENLNTIWIGRFHLFTNHVRFERPKKLVFPTYKAMPAAPSNSTGFRQPNAQDHARSYVNVVNGSSTAAVPGPYISSASALVLDDSCVVERDLSKYAMGKLKDVNSILNLRTLLMDKGFSDVKQKYLGGETLDIEDNVDSSFGRKRLCIKTKQPVSILESFKIIFKAHSSFSEEVSGDDSESDVEEVSETIFGDKSSSPNNNSDEMGFTPEVSEIWKENDQGAKEFPSLVNAKAMNNSQKVYHKINRESVDPNVVKE
nr:RNA-directed DNA polymerase, eukaryota, nucleotide-binding alpha-beta plait domain protein [Tanacetum cinerariifolium]